MILCNSKVLEVSDVALLL